MKLFYAPASPFVRKVRVAAMELGLHDRIELIRTDTTPVRVDPALPDSNPLGKIPALVTDAGEELYDSAVICEYLDSLVTDIELTPAAGPVRWRIRRQEALSDGLMDAAVLIRYEQALRPEDRRWPDWIEGQSAKISAALDKLEDEAETVTNGVTLASVAAGCALGYLDFRFSAMDWRRSRPGLAEWFAEWDARPSMRETSAES